MNKVISYNLYHISYLCEKKLILLTVAKGIAKKCISIFKISIDCVPDMANTAKKYDMLNTLVTFISNFFQ